MSTRRYSEAREAAVRAARADTPASRRDILLRATPWNFRSGQAVHLDRLDPSHVWLVDDCDDPRFRRGWAVSIALLRQGVPVLGVVFAPTWPDEQGEWFAWHEGADITHNGRPVQTRLDDRAVDARSVIYLPPEADEEPLPASQAVAPARYVRLPSLAHRLARVALAEGDAALSASPLESQSYAAGHALILAAGGVVVDQRGEPLRYSADGRGEADLCFGGAPAVVHHLLPRSWSFPSSSRSTATPYRLWRPEPSPGVRDDGRLARAQGCLLGQIAGDALGGLVEFQDMDQIRAAYSDGVRELIDGGAWGNLAGQPTDDSELALMLARTMAHHGRYDSGAVIDAYCHWYKRAWDIGGTIRRSLGAAVRGKDTAERLRLASENADPSRPTNGSLMRISPLGIFAAGRPVEGAAWARQDSRLTHPSPVSQGACAVYVAALAAAIGRNAGPEEVYAAALDAASAEAVDEEVVAALRAARSRRPDDYVTMMGWVLIALQNAFYQLLHAPSLEEGIVDTVMHGGDTDTTGAIAGALLGAVHGVRAVPAQWRVAILSCRTLPQSGTRHPQPPEFWPVDVLELAEALLPAAN